MDYDILAFTVTHLDGNVCNDDILIENYDNSYRSRPTGKPTMWQNLTFSLFF